MLFIVWGVIAITALVASASSCTLSYQNISTHGTTDEVGDTQQEASPNVTADVSASLTPVPKLPILPAGVK